MCLARLQLGLRSAKFGRRGGTGGCVRVEGNLGGFAERANERVTRGLLILRKLDETRNAKRESFVSERARAQSAVPK